MKMLQEKAPRYQGAFQHWVVRKPASWKEMRDRHHMVPEGYEPAKKALLDIYKLQGGFITVNSRQRPFDAIFSDEDVDRSADMLVEVNFNGDLRYYYVDNEGYNYARLACDVTDVVAELDEEHGGARWESAAPTGERLVEASALARFDGPDYKNYAYGDIHGAERELQELLGEFKVRAEKALAKAGPYLAPAMQSALEQDLRAEIKNLRLPSTPRLSPAQHAEIDRMRRAGEI